MRENLAVLREPEYRKLFTGQAASLLGDGMVNVALAFAVIGLGGGAAAVGLVFAVRTVPLVACLLVGGVVADRISRRAVMVAADVTRLASQGAIAALLITDHASIAALAVLSGVTGAATGFFNPASVGLLPEVVAPERLQQANGLRATAQATGEILGPVIAGVLVSTAGAGWALAIDAATFAISAVFLGRILMPERAVREHSTFFEDLREGWSTFRAMTWVWAFVAGAAIGNTLWGAWSVIGPVVAEADLGGAATWGAILAAMGAGGLVGGLTAIRVRPWRPLVAATLSVPVFALPLAFLAAGAPAPLLGAAALLSGAAMMFGNTVWESTLQRHAPPASLSRLSAYDWFGSLAFRPLGLAIWGPVAAAAGYSTSLWIAFVLLIASALAVLAVNDVRRLTDATRVPAG
jgi:predicted MFS family arabinose efflux permease